MGILEILQDFASGTSIHVLGYIVNPKTSKLKKITWAVIFIAAMMYATQELTLSVICNIFDLIKIYL
jgi:hypothetical protein